MDIETLIKKIFPTYKIYNATDKTEEQIKKIIKICLSVDNLIVFTFKNDKNSSFFKTYETNHERKIVVIFFNKDDYIYFENDKDETNEVESFEEHVRAFKNFIEDNHYCYICYEKFESDKKNIATCGKCGSSFCYKCIINMVNINDNIICPMCKSFTLLDHV